MNNKAFLFYTLQLCCWLVTQYAMRLKLRILPDHIPVQGHWGNDLCNTEIMDFRY